MKKQTLQTKTSKDTKVLGIHVWECTEHTEHKLDNIQKRSWEGEKVMENNKAASVANKLNT